MISTGLVYRIEFGKERLHSFKFFVSYFFNSRVYKCYLPDLFCKVNNMLTDSGSHKCCI